MYVKWLSAKTYPENNVYDRSPSGSELLYDENNSRNELPEGKTPDRWENNLGRFRMKIAESIPEPKRRQRWNSSERQIDEVPTRESFQRELLRINSEK